MLSAGYLDSISDELEGMYAQLHQDILVDIARRVKKTGVLTGTADWQFQMLLQQGYLKSDIISEVAKYTNLSTKKVSSLFSDAMRKSYTTDKVVYSKLGWSTDRLMNQTATTLIAGMMKTNTTLANMTGIIQNNTSGIFESICTRTYMQVQSGAFTYDQASAFASDELLRQDKEKIVYTQSGANISIEAGARRAIVTGINQTVCQSMLNIGKELGSNLVETTAHYGARPDHQVWQGRVFSLEGSTKKYPNFYTNTGYGSVTGLGGANCRHNFHPFFEGISERQYSSKQVKKWNDDIVTFNGKKMTYYDATQKMRGYERSIRSLKKVKGVNSELGASNTTINKRIQAYSQKAKSLSNQTDVPVDYARRRIANKY